MVIVNLDSNSLGGIQTTDQHTIKIKIISGGIGKTELSIKEINARNQEDFGWLAFAIVH